MGNRNRPRDGHRFPYVVLHPECRRGRGVIGMKKLFGKILDWVLRRPKLEETQSAQAGNRWPDRMYWLVEDPEDGWWNYIITVDFFHAEKLGVDDYAKEFGFVWADQDDRAVYYLPPMRYFLGTPSEREEAARWLAEHADVIEDIKMEVGVIEFEI